MPMFAHRSVGLASATHKKTAGAPEYRTLARLLQSLGAEVPESIRKMARGLRGGDRGRMNHWMGLEAIEQRVFLSASVAGAVFHDGNNNGALDSGEAGQPGVTVFADANNNGTLDNGEVATLSADVGAFAPFSGFSTGTAPGSVASGNFDFVNGPDLVVVNNGSVSLLLNNGSGSFTASPITPLNGTNPKFISVADLNGDSTADLVVVDSVSNSVSVLLNDTNGGTFATKADYPVGPSGSTPQAVAIADFDGATGNDLAVADTQSGKVSLLLNNGFGVFGSAADIYDVPGSSPVSLVAGDFDGLHGQDLAIVDAAHNTVSILLNNGNGTFAAPVTYATGANPNFITTGDFNGDGHTDLAVTNQNDNNITVLLNAGEGTFPPASSVNYEVGLAPSGVTARDFNNDNLIDLVVTNKTGNTVSVLLNQGNGVFPLSPQDYNTDTAPSAIISGDFNSDGTPDLAVASSGAGKVDVLLGFKPGQYVLSNPPVGTYPIRQLTPLGFAQTVPAAGAGISVTIASNTVLAGKNFGDFQLGTASGTVFSDANGNGVFNIGETGIANVTVFADLNGNNTKDGNEPSAVSAANGTYSLTNLPAGAYNIFQQQVPSGFSQTLPAAGAGLQVTVVNASAFTNQDFGDRLDGPEIGVSGNGQDITDGDATPSASDGTDFDTIPQNSAAISRTFTVTNSGNLPLTLGTPTLPAGFSLGSDALVGTIPAGTSDTFTVLLDTDTQGTFTGEISFANSDGDENPFHFAITGAVVPPAPEIVVSGNGVSITDGDSTPSGSDGTDFGSVTQGGSATRTFTVSNIGSLPLTLGSVSLPSGFSPGADTLVDTLAPGQSDTFTVQLATGSVGAAGGDISFSNNDSNENPFNFRISGTVSAPPPPAPEIAVSGSGQNIADGDATPSTFDGTDFGTVTQNGSAVVHTFTVTNSGNATLTLGSLVLPSGFTAGPDALVGSLGPGGSDTFSVQLAAGSLGTFAGDISFTNNDGNENPFNFRITGIVAVATVPEIAVGGNGLDITDGDTTPSTLDSTDFGTANQNTAVVTHTFTVTNSGTAALTLGTPTLPAGFSLGSDALVTSLAAGTSDTFTVQLNTTTPGTFTGDISIGNNDDDENPFNFQLTGTIIAPEIALSGNSQNIADGDTTPSTIDGTDFGSALQEGSVVTKTFIVSNSGTAPLTLGAVTLPAGFSLGSDTLVSSIAPGAFDTFTVQLNTNNLGTVAGDISIVNNDSNENPFNFRITGTVVTPEIAVSGNNQNITDGSETPSTLNGTDFGRPLKGSAVVTRTFTVTNSGTAALTLGTITLPMGYSLGSDTLVTSLAIGASDTFTIQLNTTNLGTFAGDIVIPNDDIDESPFNFKVTGTVTAPIISVTGLGQSIADGDTTPSSTDGTQFGGVIAGSAAVTRTFTVMNTGTATLTLGAVTLPTGFSLGSDTLVTSLAPGASDTFTVNLNSTTVGAVTGDLVITNSDSTQNPFNFTITGNVIPSTAPEIAVSGVGHDITDGDATPSTVDGTDFGSALQLGPVVTHTFTVTNNGTATLTLGTPTLPAGFTLGSDPLVASLEPGTSDTFTVELSTATLGTFAGDISVSNNDGDENPFNFAVTGTIAGTATPEIAVSGNGEDITNGDIVPSIFDGTNFGGVVLNGTVTTRRFTVTNSGTGDLTLGPITLPAGFSLGSDPLVANLAPGASDTFSVQLDTAALGDHSGYLIISNNDSDESAFTFALTGRATATAVPEMVISALGQEIVSGATITSVLNNTDFGSVIQGGSPITHSFTITNIGSGPLTLGAVRLPVGYSLGSDTLVTSLAPGVSDSFTVQLNTVSAGPKTGPIFVANNDATQSPFNFTVTGTVLDRGISEDIGGAIKSLVYTDSDGTKVTLKLSTLTGNVLLHGNGLTAATVKGVTTVTGVVDTVDIDLDDPVNTKKSTLSVTTKGGADKGLTQIGRVSGDVLNTLSAKVADIGGDGLLFSDYVGSASARDLLGGADVEMDSNAAPKISLAFQQITSGSEISAASKIDSLTAYNVQLGTLIERGRVVKLSVKALKARGFVGNFGADMSVAGTPLDIGLGTVSIAGSVLGGDWNITGRLVKLGVTGGVTNLNLFVEPTGIVGISAAKVGGIVESSSINSLGNIIAFTAGALKNSRVFAGVKLSEVGLPDSADDFIVPGALIKSLTISGIKGLSAADAFVNSDIAAPTLTKITLKNAKLDNGGVAFGLAGETITKLTLTQADRSKFTWPAKWLPNPQDLAVRDF